MAIRDTKSGPSEEGSFQVPTTGKFPGGMPNLQAGAAAFAETSTPPLGGNEDFSGRSGFGVTVTRFKFERLPR